MLSYRPRFTGVMLARRLRVMNQNLVDAVIMAIAKQKGLDASGIGLNSSLPELGVNSLDAISIVYDIEDRFDIEVPNEMLADLESVRDIVDKLSTLITVPA
jgi:acyl carrier protein